jgi:4-hydroxy-tetrahydrodipicolinate synthase
MKELGRLITAIVTPFDEKGQVDYGCAKRLARALLASGSDGIVVAGSTGEGSTLSHEEKLKLFAEIKSAVGDKGSVIGATGNNDTADSVYLTKAAEKTGIDASLVVVPYYNKPTQEGMYLHFKTVAESTSLPCILYNIPGRSVVNLAADTIIRLSKISNIIGIKEASGNFDQISRVIDGTNDKFFIWSGNDGDTFPLMCMGGYGVISVISHLVGNQFKQMIELCVKGKTKEAAAIHHKLMPLNNAMFVVSNPMPVRHALNYLGFNIGHPRLPLTDPDEKSKAAIESVVKNYTIDLPVDKSK